MREIKFRAWDKKSCKLCPPISIQNIGECMPRYDFTNLILMQYTGLKDKNGKEIYEGDIIKIGGFDDKCTTKVEWFNGAFCDGYYHWNLGARKQCNVEIIGNIHENPELMEKL